MRNANTSEPVRNRRDAAVVTSRSHNWIAQGVCLLLAFILWIYVMQVDSPEHEETFYSVYVDLVGTAVLEEEHGLSVYGGYGDTVDVTVVGKRSVINKLTVEDIRVHADVSDLTTAGQHTVSLKADLPGGLSLRSLSENSILVYCDEKASTVVNVRAKISSFTMATSLQMGELKTDYDTIVVSGPKEVLDNIAYALVSLELGSIDASMTASGKLGLIDLEGNRIDNPYLKLSRTDVMVSIPVFTTKSIPMSVQYKHGYFTDANVKVTLEPPTLLVRGDPAVLDRMDTILVSTLDEKKIAGDITQLATIPFPEGVTAVDGTENVTVHVTHLNTYTKTFSVTDIDVSGAGGIDYRILDGSLSVTLRGTLEQLARIRTTDISAVVDLSGYSEQSSGVISEPAQIRIDSSHAAGVYEIGEYFVQVKLN